MTACNVATSSELVAKDCATWPVLDQQRWKSLFDPDLNWGDAPWVRQTQYQVGRVYTRYLADMASAGRPVTSRAGRITPAGLRRFILACEARGCCPRTIAGYARDLAKLADKLWPGRNRDWLLKTCARLDDLAGRTTKRKLSRIVGGAEIRFAAERLLAQARELGPDAGWEAIQLYRDGLFMLVAIHAPERRRALATIRLDQIDCARGVIRFDPAQIKTAEPRDRHLPPRVMAQLAEWIDVWRCRVADSHDNLWVAKGGGSAGDAALAAAFGNATERELGLRLSIHRIRDAAATLIVEKSPNSVPLARQVLGQRSEHIIDEYTETANQIEASRHLGAALEETEEEVLHRVRASSTSTIALNPRSRRIHKGNGRKGSRRR